MSMPEIFIGQNLIQEDAPARIAGIERTLGEAMKELATDLRLTDAADFAALIRMGHSANLKCLVHSSMELHFKPGTMEIAGHGELELGWHAPPVFILPLRFRNRGVLILFRLRLGAYSASVEIDWAAVDDSIAGIDLDLSLREALDDARITRPELGAERP